MLVTCLPDGSVTINAKVVLECDQKPPEPWASMLKGSPDLLEVCKEALPIVESYASAEIDANDAKLAERMHEIVAKAQGGAS